MYLQKKKERITNDSRFVGLLQERRSPRGGLALDLNLTARINQGQPMAGGRIGWGQVWYVSVPNNVTLIATSLYSEIKLRKANYKLMIFCSALTCKYYT